MIPVRVRTHLLSTAVALALGSHLLPAHALLDEFRWDGYLDDPVITNLGDPRGWRVPVGTDGSGGVYLDYATHAPDANASVTFHGTRNPAAVGEPFSNIYWGRILATDSSTTVIRRPGIPEIPQIVIGNSFEQAALVMEDRAKLQVEGLRISAWGSAILAPDASLRLLSGTQWFHSGEFVLSTSTIASGNSAYLHIESGSSLAANLVGEALNVTAGSTSQAFVLVFGDQARLDVNQLTVGGVTFGSHSEVRIGNSATLVARQIDLGRVGQGTLDIGISGRQLVGEGPGALQAQRVYVGRQGTGSLSIGQGSIAEVDQLQVGYEDGSSGHVWVTGYVNSPDGEVFASRLIVRQSLNIGGYGGSSKGEVKSSGDLIVGGQVRIGGDWGTGQSSLSTYGSFVVGVAGRYDGVSMGINSTWNNHGQSVVHGTMSMASYGNYQGSGATLRVASGGSLSVGRGIDVGDYHVFNTAPEVKTQIIVESNAVLTTPRLTLHGDAQLSGGGTVRGDVVVQGGTIAPGMSPGWLTIDGDLIFSNWAGGLLIVEIGGTQPGIGYDVLQVTGTLDLGANAVLELRTYNGFTPVAGQSFAFLHVGKLLGRFAAVSDTTGLGIGVDDLQFTQGNFGIHVAAVPEPETYAMLLAGLALVALVRRTSASTRCRPTAASIPPPSPALRAPGSRA